MEIKATHIVGGEMYYECLGNDDYLITLKVYRDCGPANSNNTPFDDPAFIAIYDTDGSLVENLSISFPGASQVPVVINNPCLLIPPEVCVEEAVYTKVVNLPPKTGGYDIVYQRCCRNPTIINLIDPQDAGATYAAYIPDDVSCNSSPYFDNFPPVAICKGDPLTFDHSATDPDGDDLVYQFCTPFHGGTPTAPKPNPPTPPPFPYVTWETAYSNGYQISSSPSFSIDPQTGLLTGTPDMLGQFVVGVCVEEYRNGVLLSTTKRDFQFNVTDCNADVEAEIVQQEDPCSGFTVDFENNSQDATYFYWDFGDPHATNDTSLLEEPSYSYSDTGSYTVMLIANPGWACADTTYQLFNIYPPIAAYFSPLEDQCISNNAFDFSAGGIFNSDVDITWDFGSNASPPSSNLPNPQNVTFAFPGTYPITLVYADTVCSDTFVDFITVDPLVFAEIPEQTIFCEGMTVEYGNNSSNTDEYFWDFGVPGTDADTSDEESPIFTFPGEGTYEIILTANPEGPCIDQDTAYYEVLPLLAPEIEVDSGQCIDLNSFDYNAAGVYSNSASFQWSFGGNADPGSSNVEHPDSITYAVADTHAVYLTVSEPNGCVKSVQSKVVVYPAPEPDFFIDNKSGCTPLSVSFYDNSASWTELEYLWDFGDGILSFDQNPSHKYTTPGNYTVNLTIKSNVGCTDPITFESPADIIVHELPDAGFVIFPEDHERSIFEPVFNFTDFSDNSLSCTYYTGDGLSFEQCNFEYEYKDTGNYMVTQVVYNEHGCTDTLNKDVRINPEYTFFAPNAFTPDGDGMNDGFLPWIQGVESYELYIFDRWGEEIFHTTNRLEPWNGRVDNNKELCKHDVYVFLVNAVDVFRQSHQYVGHVTLIR